MGEGPKSGFEALNDVTLPANHPRSAEYRRAREKQILMCSLQPWACSQVKVRAGQWMVGPSRNSRLRPGETLAGASSAVNGRACRWPQAAGGDWSAALDRKAAVYPKG